MKRYLMPILLVPIIFIAFGVTLAAGTSGVQPTAKKSAKKATKKESWWREGSNQMPSSYNGVRR